MVRFRCSNSQFSISRQMMLPKMLCWIKLRPRFSPSAKTSLSKSTTASDPLITMSLRIPSQIVSRYNSASTSPRISLKLESPKERAGSQPLQRLWLILLVSHFGQSLWSISFLLIILEDIMIDAIRCMFMRITVEPLAWFLKDRVLKTVTLSQTIRWSWRSETLEARRTVILWQISSWPTSGLKRGKKKAIPSKVRESSALKICVSQALLESWLPKTSARVQLRKFSNPPLEYKREKLPVLFLSRKGTLWAIMWKIMSIRPSWSFNRLMTPKTHPLKWSKRASETDKKASMDSIIRENHLLRHLIRSRTIQIKSTTTSDRIAGIPDRFWRKI